MRGVETRIQEIRHKGIFREAARMAYHTEWPLTKDRGASI